MVIAPPVLASSLAALDRAGVRWCLLRDLSGIRQRDDVDLLVADDDMPTLRRTLVRLGYAELPSWGRGSHRFFLIYDSSEDLWVKLDVVSRLAFGRHAELDTGAATACLRRRQRAGGLSLLDADDRFWALMLHCLLDRNEFAHRHRMALREQAGGARGSSPLRTWFERHARDAGWTGSMLLAAVTAGEWESIRNLDPAVRSSASRADPTTIARRLTRRVLRRMTKLRTLVSGRGISVALLGPDGAGKSTLAEGLARTYYAPVRTIYMGLYGKGAGGRLPRGLLGRLARQWTGVLVGTFHRLRGRLVVFDRWGYDARLGSSPDAGLRSSLRRWLLSHAVPRPDLVIVLDAPAEMLFQRKGEHDVEALEVQRSAYRALADDLPDAHLVAADRSPEQVLRAVTALVWERSRRRRGASAASTNG